MLTTENIFDNRNQNYSNLVDWKQVEKIKGSVPQDTTDPKDTLLVRWVDYRQVPKVPGCQTKPYVPFDMSRESFEALQPASKGRLKLICVKKVFKLIDENLQIEAPTRGGSKEDEQFTFDSNGKVIKKQKKRDKEEITTVSEPEQVATNSGEPDTF